ncbi:TPA: GNAT family N-acetyltransferase [Candidatus Woesearchaeota archaeon]|nr:GNAT family N-acetyltransferase [Candidatus Woesearchaeota archaeon]
MLKQVQEKDYIHLVKLYKSFFRIHNIFSGNKNVILKYLKEQAQKNELIVFEEKSSISGALYLVNFGQNDDGSHKLWKFRHFAFDSNNIALKMLNEAEKRVKRASKTSKIELTIAENEVGIEFYKNNGYRIEGQLTHHYRYGETCYILAKGFKR